MIAYLRGALLDKTLDSVIVDVHGVGYRVHVSQTSLAQLPETGSPVTLRVHTHVREDALQLFGFTSPEEEELFHHLMHVSGVGPKLALNILSGMQPSELALAIANGELARLTKIGGVGKKTAERLVLELADKLKVSSIIARKAALTAPGKKAQPTDDLLSALVNLGYRPGDAERAAQAARERSPEADIEGLVRLSLQLLVSKAV